MSKLPNPQHTAFPSGPTSVGISVQEYFAAAAMTGVLAAAHNMSPDQIAKYAVDVAEKTIAELQRRDPLNT